MIPWLGPHDPFPPVGRALREPNGLLAAGRTLSIPTLLEAYSPVATALRTMATISGGRAMLIFSAVAIQISG